MSEKRPRDQARSDGDNTFVRKNKKARGGSVTDEDKEDYNNEELLSFIMPALSKIVTEVVEQILPGLLEQKLPGHVEQILPGLVEQLQHCACRKRHHGKQMDEPASRSLQLEFRNKPSLPIFTMTKVEGEESSDLTIALVDTVTRKIVNSGPESMMEVEIVVLQGDFKGNKDDNWTSEHFSRNIVVKREGKRQLLAGNGLLTLNDGIGVAHELKITDNSSWTRSGEFRLAARVVDGNFDGMRVKEAITEPFVVKENRGKDYEKRHPPLLDDKVWRLENIRKDGVFQERLRQEGIFTVKDFLIKLHIDTQGLQDLLGAGMTNSKWEVIKNHAEECDVGEETYVYCPKDGQGTGVVFNIVRTATGLLREGEIIRINDLSDNEKEDMLKMVRVAYEHPEEIVHYANGDILGNSSNVPANSFTCDSMRPNNSAISDNQHYGGLCSPVPELSYFLSGSPRLGIPTASNYQHSGGHCFPQPQAAFQTSMACSDDYNFHVTGGAELGNNVGLPIHADGPILGSSSTVPFNSILCRSPRLEIPTVSNYQHSGGHCFPQPQVAFPTSMACSDDYNFEETGGTELRNNVGPPIHADGPILGSWLASMVISDDYNFQETRGMEFGNNDDRLILADNFVLARDMNLPPDMFTSGSTCMELPTDVSSNHPYTGVNNLDDEVYVDPTTHDISSMTISHYDNLPRIDEMEGVSNFDNLRHGHPVSHVDFDANLASAGNTTRPSEKMFRHGRY